MMTDDDYNNLAKVMPEKILNELGVTVKKNGDRAELETSEGTYEEHVSRLASILAIQAKLFDYSLLLSLSLKNDNEGIIAINHLRTTTIDRTNKQANKIIERYVENNIITGKRE